VDNNSKPVLYNVLQERDMFMLDLERVKILYGINSFQGYSEEEVGSMRQVFGALPKVLEDFYYTAGRTEAFRNVQDIWMSPEKFKKCGWLKDDTQTGGMFVILNENQGVCQAGVRKEDLSLADPPVYNFYCDELKPCAPSVSEFLVAALVYEAVFSFDECSEDFYYLEEKDMDILKSRLDKLPLEIQSWVGDMKITMYSNAPDNLVTVMECDGEYNICYGAVTKASFDHLSEAIEDIGEPL